jgi:spore coat polysaccharide biosynthesis protein SpsF (cytidylyltransferase family)
VEDLDFVKKIYRNFEGKGYFAMQDILDFLALNPAFSRTNQDVVRNQSYNEMVKNEQ